MSSRCEFSAKATEYQHGMKCVDIVGYIPIYIYTYYTYVSMYTDICYACCIEYEKHIHTYPYKTLFVGRFYIKAIYHTCGTNTV